MAQDIIKAPVRLQGYPDVQINKRNNKNKPRQFETATNQAAGTSDFLSQIILKVLAQL